MIEANRWKLGLFIIIGVALLLGGIFFFGLSQFFVPKIKVLTIFAESVDGLSVGSPVKYNGVPMGTVSEIMIEHQGNILVYMDLYPKVLAAKDRKHITKQIMNKKYLKNFVESYVDRGFRCSLQLVGISGNKYIGIEQYNIENSDLLNPELKKIIDDNLYIPSIPTFVSGAVANVSKLLNKISKVNFSQISSNINNAFSSLDSLLYKVDSLIKTLESQGLQRILLNTTSKLDQTLDAVTELSNQISEQPNSVLRGNKSGVIFPTK